MKLNNDQNAAFMNDPRLVAAEKALHEAVDKIRDSLVFNGTAGYYLSVLPPLLKRLEEADEHLTIVAATVEAEILGKIPKEEETP